MKLFFRGIEVPSLGSTRDRIFRDYLLHEAKVEAKKHQLLLLTTMGSTFISDASNRRAWDEQASQVFDEYVMLNLGLSTLPQDRETTLMQKFYSEVVKDSRPTLKRGKDGKLSVTDLPFNADGSKDVKTK